MNILTLKRLFTHFRSVSFGFVYELNEPKCSDAHKDRYSACIVNKLKE